MKHEKYSINEQLEKIKGNISRYALKKNNESALAMCEQLEAEIFAVKMEVAYYGYSSAERDDILLDVIERGHSFLRSLSHQTKGKMNFVKTSILKGRNFQLTRSRSRESRLSASGRSGTSAQNKSKSDGDSGDPDQPDPPAVTPSPNRPENLNSSYTSWSCLGYWPMSEGRWAA
jgi:hypothetical protein